MLKSLVGGHDDFVTSVCFSLHDPNVVASASTDKSIIVWDVKRGKPIYVFNDHSDEVHSLSWSPTAEGLLASGSHDHSVMVFDAGLEDGGGELYKKLDGHATEVSEGVSDLFT